MVRPGMTFVKTLEPFNQNRVQQNLNGTSFPSKEDNAGYAISQDLRARTSTVSILSGSSASSSQASNCAGGGSSITLKD